MLLIILLVACGIGALRQGQVKITNKRIVDGETSRLIGWILLVGAVLTIIFGGELGWAVLLIAIIIGLARSKPVVI
jgi:hypothetical protein